MLEWILVGVKGEYEIEVGVELGKIKKWDKGGVFKRGSDFESVV